MSVAIYNDLVASFSATVDQDDIHSMCCGLCRELGFDYFIYGIKIPTSFVKPHITIISGYPGEWRERYDAQGHINVDPTVSFCSTNLVPVTWDRFRDLERQDDQVRGFMNESRDFGLRSGVSIPIHDGRGGRAMLSLVSNREHEEMALHLRENLPFVHALSFHIHEAVRRTMETVGTTTHQLSCREADCLRWAAEGKTSWETSRILGISERTVIFHLQRVSGKLQVSNRSHAVARAISLGVI